MFDRILVPLDGSPRAEIILKQLVPILRRQDSEVILTRAAIHDPGESFIVGGVDLARVSHELREEATTYTQGMVQRLAQEGVRARACVPEGVVPEALLEAARQERATLIAMTTHGRTGLARWMTGSVAEKLLRTSEIPVLLVPSFASAPDGARTPSTAAEIHFRKILMPVDGSPISMSALPATIHVARFFEAEVTVLSVRPVAVIPALPGEKPRAMSDRALFESFTGPAVAKFREAGIRVTPVTLDGDPASRIVDYCTEKGMDLIAMATHGRSGLSRWLLGSVAERVLRSSRVPLLLVRPPGP